MVFYGRTCEQNAYRVLWWHAEEFLQAVAAAEWTTAHSVLVMQLAPRWWCSGRIGQLRSCLKQLEASAGPVQAAVGSAAWKSGAHLYYTFFNLEASILPPCSLLPTVMPASRPAVSSAMTVLRWMMVANCRLFTLERRREEDLHACRLRVSLPACWTLLLHSCPRHPAKLHLMANFSSRSESFISITQVLICTKVHSTLQCSRCSDSRE